ncbi:transmembrane ascorbate-dependent reductase CYB561-like isoform X2 [Oppia nitens]|nr:transmembrane ascorbate-dependent reductase CYB561-like isoform X2 [Oppia nitens]
MMDYDSSSARQDGFGIGGGPIGSVTNFFASFILSQVFGLFIIVFVSVWISRYLGGISFADSLLIFNFHPLFMTLGMVFIFGDAILVYRVMRNERKKILKILHAVLHGLALGLALLGSWSVWYYHSSKGIPNLYSLHSWLGLLTMGLFTSQYALGFVSFLFPGLAPGYRRIVLPYHVYIGVTLFVLAAVTSLLGITEKAFFSLDGKVNPRYADKPGAAYVINMLGLSIVIFVAIVVYLVTNNQYRRRPLPEEQALQLQNEETTSMN